MKPRALTAFILSVDLAALATLPALSTGSLREKMGTFLLLATLAALLGARPIRIPFRSTELSATHPFIFCALVALGSLPAGLVGLAGVLGGAVAGAIARGRPPAARRLAFNLGAVFLSALAASGVFLAAGGGHPGQSLTSLVRPLGAAAVIYFLVNTGLVAAAISLEKNQPFARTWKVTFMWTAPSTFAGLPLAIAMLVVLSSSMLWTAALSIPACWSLRAFYRSHAQAREAAAGAR